jgi:hypothetical protein
MGTRDRCPPFVARVVVMVHNHGSENQGTGSGV